MIEATRGEAGVRGARSGVFRRLVCRAAVAVLVAATTACTPQYEYDVAIVGGKIVDGTGAPSYRANIGVLDGQIVKIGEVDHNDARRVVRAAGLTVSPGMIDTHNHAVADPRAPGNVNEALLKQGITTAVAGADGEIGLEFFRALRETYRHDGSSVNVAVYIGHNELRRKAMGSDPRTPSPEELSAIIGAVRLAMTDGALGVATNLFREPASASGSAELRALAGAAGDHGGTLVIRARNPFDDPIGSLAEAVDLAEAAKVPVRISQLTSPVLADEPELHRFLEIARAALADDIDITLDQAPYTIGLVQELSELFRIPPDLVEMSPITLREALLDEQVRTRVREASEVSSAGHRSWIEIAGYPTIRILVSPDRPQIEGLTLAQFAATERDVPFEAIANLFLEAHEPLYVGISTTSEDALRGLLAWEGTIFSTGSDAIFPGHERHGHDHPKSTGAFPRLLGKYARDEGLFPLEDAIYRATGLPARHLRLVRRGLIREGFFADLIVFDEGLIEDRSSWRYPHATPTGISHVLVNGVPVVWNGAATDELPGQYVTPLSKAGR